MGKETRADAPDAVSRLGDAGGKAILKLAVLPLRMFIGALDILETQVHKAADGLRDIDPLDERVVELEERIALLEQQPAGRRQGSRTPAVPKQTTAAVSHDSEQVEPGTSRHEEAPGSDTAADHGVT